MEYLLKRNKNQKSFRMHFSDDGQLIVSVPYVATKEQINEFISKNLQWIKEHKELIPVHNYENNETFYYFGKPCSLLVVKGTKDKVECPDDKLIVTLGYSETKTSIQRLIYYFYGNSVIDTVKPLVAKWSEKMGLKVPFVYVSNAKTSWAVCRPKEKQIRFSAMTAVLDKELIEMICVHELCHFFYCNHSKDFWEKVASYIPDVAEKEKRLKAIAKSGIARNMF